MTAALPKQKVVVVGAGPVGALAALYAASRGDEVEVYELRGGESVFAYFISVTPGNMGRVVQYKASKASANTAVHHA